MCSLTFNNGSTVKDKRRFDSRNLLANPYPEQNPVRCCIWSACTVNYWILSKHVHPYHLCSLFPGLFAGFRVVYFICHFLAPADPVTSSPVSTARASGLPCFAVPLVAVSLRAVLFRLLKISILLLLYFPGYRCGRGRTPSPGCFIPVRGSGVENPGRRCSPAPEPQHSREAAYGRGRGPRFHSKVT